MSSRTLGWYAGIEHPFEQPWDADHPVLDPIVPSIAHSLHPELCSLIERIGAPRELEPGEPLIAPGAPVDKLIIVKKGITAREVGLISGAIAISPPRHIACGNLNLFSSLPCIGSYFALVRSSVIQVEQKLFLSLLRSDKSLAWLFAIQSELCTLSDRMAFATYTQPVEIRLQAFFIAWARNYGRCADDSSGQAWCVMPAAIQRKHLAAIASTSRVSLDKNLKAWKAEGAYASRGDLLLMRPALLEPAYRWMADMEDCARIRRPATFLEFIRGIEERRQLAGARPLVLP